MANNDPHIILFDAYLQKRLSPEQMADFENRLEKESDFQAQFVRYQQLSHLLEGVVEDDAFAERENRLDSLSQEIEAALKESVPPKEAKSKRPRWQTLLPLTAVILLIAIVPLFFPWFNKNKSECDPQSLYNTYAQDWSSFHFRTMMSAGHNTSSQPRLAAAEAYGLKKYEQALTILQPYLADTLDSEASLLQALCYLQLEQYEESLNSLAQITPDSEDYEDAIWVKALASLRQADYPLLRRTLKQIVLEQNPHQTEAQKIEKELDCLSASPAP